MSSVCRICLAGNTRLNQVENKVLLCMYEKLSNSKFNSEDARPRALCCFCYQKLLKCHAFSQMALTSEKILSHLYARGLQVTHESITEVNPNLKQHLSVATMQSIKIDDNTSDAGSQVTVKDEPSFDMKEEVTTEPDKLLDVESSQKSRLNFEEDYSDQENDTDELLFNTHTDQSKPDDSSCIIKDEPLPSMDTKEEVTTEVNELVEIGSIRLRFEEDYSDPDKGVGKLNHKIHVVKAKADDSKTTFSCNDYLKIYDMKSKLISHMGNSHSQFKEKQCFFTKKHTETASMIEDKTIHNQNKKLNCHVCEKQFNSKSTLIRHIRTHTGEKPFACNECHKQFNKKNHLVTHMRTRTHTGETPFAYNVRDKDFIQKSTLITHMKTHTGKKPFACNVCDKKFNRKSKLATHMRTHTGEKPFTCNVCHKQFNLKGNLDRHARTHTGEPPFACNVCDKKFHQKSFLVTHMRIHTGEKPFACNVCHKQFNQKGHLVKHVRTHTGQTPFACNVCDKQFKQKTYLVQHMRTHTGETPFACDVCDKQFNRRNNLVRHMRTHTGEKPFACNVCDKQFNRKRALVTHMRTHTGDNPFCL